jgi:hypothetical protein
MNKISPLEEPEVNSLDELFSRDPVGYSESDLHTIVVELRRQRKNWIVAEGIAKPLKKPAKVKGPELSLDDLV